MALTIEDGSIVASSNSYGDTTDFTAYATARGKTITSGKAEEYLLRSMDVIEYMPLPGNRLTKEQSLQWPRANVTIDGFAVEEDEIPELLIEIQFEAGLAINEGYDPIAVVSRVAKKVVVGPITKEFADNSPSVAIYQPLYNKIQRLLGSSPNNGFEFSVSPA